MKKIIYINFNPVFPQTEPYIIRKKKWTLKKIHASLTEHGFSVDHSVELLSFVYSAHLLDEDRISFLDYFIKKNSTQPSLLIIDSAMDLSDSHSTSIRFINRLIQDRILFDAYIADISLTRPFSSYVDTYLDYCADIKADGYRQPSPPYMFYKYALSLRRKEPPIKYCDIQQYLGIERTTLINKIKRNKLRPITRQLGRSITEDEIADIEKFKEDAYCSICKDLKISVDPISISDILTERS